MDPSAVTTFLFTDIEGSSRLWEEQPERMQRALNSHDHILRAAVESNHGVVVKMTGDGLHAAFSDPRDAVTAAIELQLAVEGAAATDGLPLRVRCGMHAGVIEQRDGDFFGAAVNRAARIMSAAHGGQVLVSQGVASLLRDRLPEGISLRDLGAARLRDLSSAEQIYQVEHARLRREFPALRSLEAIPNNLPQQVTTFVGRDRELHEVKAALAKARLLTLSGIGGLGKTRLALQVAADVLNDYPDGVWFVELAPLTDEHLVPLAVATILGVREDAARPVIEALTRHVRDRQLLIVLDNCEHLIQACRDLAKQLLQAGPKVKVLASTREHFNIAGETMYMIPPLSVPRTKGGVSVDSILRCEAVQLFVERARAVQSTFVLSDENAPAIVEICQSLDGIPLALELAAARVRAMSVDQIAARVNDRFRLLTNGDRTALPRQQTLRALIDWSHDLLMDKERILFRRLAVFAGGWTLEAAEAVASGGHIDASEVLDLLVGLVDKSLAIAEPQSARYGFLETVRQFAEERLKESGKAERERVRKRHLGFYLDLAEKAGAGLSGQEQPQWLERLDRDRENIVLAHAFCLRTDGAWAEHGYRFVHAIRHYWFIRGLLSLSHRLGMAAISNPSNEPASLARCRALWVVGQMCGHMGRYQEAQGYLEESLEIARKAGDKRTMASVMHILTLASLGQGDRAAARHHSEAALKLAQELGDSRRIAVASNALAQLNRLEGKLDEAEPLYLQTVSFGRELGDREMTAIGMLNLAMVAVARGTAGRARELLVSAIAIANETGSTQARQSTLEVTAGLAAALGEWERSARFFGAAEARKQSTGIKNDPADDAFLQPFVAKARAALGEPRFTAAEASGRTLGFLEAVADASAWLLLRPGP